MRYGRYPAARCRPTSKYPAAEVKDDDAGPATVKVPLMAEIARALDADSRK